MYIIKTAETTREKAIKPRSQPVVSRYFYPSLLSVCMTVSHPPVLSVSRSKSYWGYGPEVYTEQTHLHSTAVIKLRFRNVFHNSFEPTKQHSHHSFCIFSPLGFGFTYCIQPLTTNKDCLCQCHCFCHVEREEMQMATVEWPQI